MCVDGRLHSFHRIPSIHSHCLGMPLDKFDCHLGMVFVLPHQQIRIKLKILSTHTDIFGWDEIVMYFHTQSFHTFFVLFFFSFYLRRDYRTNNAFVEKELEAPAALPDPCYAEQVSSTSLLFHNRKQLPTEEKKNRREHKAKLKREKIRLLCSSEARYEEPKNKYYIQTKKKTMTYISPLAVRPLDVWISISIETKQPTIPYETPNKNSNKQNP